MRADVLSWYDRRCHHWSDWDARSLLDLKADATVSVVLPALNEQATVGAIVTGLRESLVDEVPLVDELVVVDSGSTDRTVAAAADAGARVVRAREVLPELGEVPGKGEALWKSLFSTSGDLVVFLDSDLVEFGPHYVTGLLGPLLGDPGVAFVKAFYDRPPLAGGAGAGRVTELVARPLLNLYWPELAGVVQPLAGEYAARRSLLEQLPFATGYGVEIGLLVDLLGVVPLDALAQVDLGRREHAHQADADLGAMAATILRTALSRLPGHPPSDVATLVQFQRVNQRQQPTERSLPVRERPPARSIGHYDRRHAYPGAPT